MDVVIGERYRGPAGSGNGGWTAGSVAGFVTPTPAVTVTLRVPPPLDTPMTVGPADGAALGRIMPAGSVEIHAPDGTLVADAGPAADPDADTGTPVGWDEARAVEASYPGFAAHPFPGCFVCGPERATGDGLRLFPGRLPDGRTATAWTVPADVSPAMIWAALDCPGGWAIDIEARPYVLGRMTARIDALPEPGDRCVVMGRLIDAAGRKATVASGLHAPDGRTLAVARATWLAVG